MNTFSFTPHSVAPFRDQAVLERVRSIRREDIATHPNPDFRIQVVRDMEVPFISIADRFYRLKTAMDEGREVAFIMGNPNPGYVNFARLINRFQVNCSKLWIFAMDEWADDAGNIAPESYPQGFRHAMMKYLYAEIEEKLRPPVSQMLSPNNRNINDYSKMLADRGGADACYSGSGWTGHIAFIDPQAPQWSSDLEEFKQQGTRIVDLHPLTVAQNSLHGSFGFSGDVANVPPKAATIGPADVLGAKYRMDVNALCTCGTVSSWQRLITRLIAHGPVTPDVPASILQTVPTDFYISESAAADIRPHWYAGY
jgi:6-phosphogluconolactonase/glucosamine-6-phosphate isomerase/deaminase